MVSAGVAGFRILAPLPEFTGRIAVVNVELPSPNESGRVHVRRMPGLLGLLGYATAS